MFSRTRSTPLQAVTCSSYSISNTQDEGPVKNQIAKVLAQRIIRAAEEGTKFKVVVVIPEVPGFAGPGMMRYYSETSQY